MSEIRATTISDLAGTGPATLTGQYAAKAWVNFNGTGTVAIRESGNVSSITDNGTGDYTVNFTTALTDASYSASGSGEPSAVGWGIFAGKGNAGAVRTTSAYRFVIANTTGSGFVDCENVSVTITR